MGAPNEGDSEMVMLTRDLEDVARRGAATVGLTDVVAEAPLDDKVLAVKRKTGAIRWRLSKMALMTPSRALSRVCGNRDRRRGRSS